ncbi:hypothetical protein CfE428DRAFT_4518 [Chthoniobacter flavus Ellin428]|uniref:NlpC/P60 domain-containing protein n=1 Tax=Chthoniobacter flavus Ellin428 TaxID=497964 RepID=B4D6H8_9BACT|nr:hypothetical protein [Chthoniobacter flavus]EDY18087.1 hypothetical protein CfE428DRAFT_4518 [Chthoniobacter flavus Ellin428]TCO88328.1 hypothetical protein EV701_118125 [Chthoniobacter flavus]
MNRIFTYPASLFAGAVMVLLALAPTSQAHYTSATPPTSGPTIPGDKAALDRNGIAYAPENAPECVKRAIWATNFLRNKPYVWGGGHESFYVDGYDCSGTVSFLLHHAGLINSPIVSKDFTGYGTSGKGHWITIYAKDGHVFAVVAGLRLDTTGFGGEDGPRWRINGRPAWGFTARHPNGL